MNEIENFYENPAAEFSDTDSFDSVSEDESENIYEEVYEFADLKNRNSKFYWYEKFANTLLSAIWTWLDTLETQLQTANNDMKIIILSETLCTAL